MMRFGGMSLNSRYPSQLKTGRSVNANPPATFSAAAPASTTFSSPGILRTHSVREVRFLRRLVSDLQHRCLDFLVAPKSRLHDERERPGREQRAFHWIKMLPGEIHVRDSMRQRA